MKSIKHIALGAFFTLCVFCVVVQSSCSKNEGAAVTCLNGGKNAGGICNCVVGTSGVNCEIVYRKLYGASYKGTTLGNIGYTDTGSVLIFSPDTQDTADYTTMHVTWLDTNLTVVTLPIKLTNFSAVGATFNIVETTLSNVVYKGGGSINGTTASMYLNEYTPNPGGSPNVVNLRFNDFYKK